jgi:DNA-binding NtrC family response regulator
VTPPRVLLVDDDPGYLRLMSAKLAGEYEVQAIADGEQAIPAIIRWRPAVVLLDIEMEARDTGLRILADLQGLTDAPPVIMLTRDDAPETARRAGALGADGFLPKTVELAEIRGTITRALNDRSAGVRADAPIARSSAAPAGVDSVPEIPGLVATSAAMHDLLRRVQRVAPSRATVLLLGETGVGKGVLARAIHALSGRRGPFVRCDGTTMPRELMHAELVGYRAGAFTGANCDYGGHFAAAHGGTLFVDEIGEASLEMQGALLHAVETGEVTPLGEAGRTRTFDVRVVAATNKDLEAMAREGRFKADLLARLNVYPLRIPPLRERRDDILPLARHYLARFAAEEGRPELRLAPSVRVYLRQHDWPENVRGVENAMRRAVIDAPDGEVALGHLLAGGAPGGAWLRPYSELEAEHVARLQREYLQVVLAATGGQVSEAATLSGVTRKTLYEWLKRHGMQAEDFR